MTLKDNDTLGCPNNVCSMMFLRNYAKNVFSAAQWHGASYYYINAICRTKETRYIFVIAVPYSRRWSLEEWLIFTYMKENFALSTPCLGQEAPKGQKFHKFQQACYCICAYCFW